MELLDGVGEQDATDVAIGGVSGLLLAIGGTVDADDTTGSSLGEAQLAQASNDWAESFGRITSSPLKRAAAAFTISSSDSRSLIR
jgi:hypothetical protein